MWLICHFKLNYKDSGVKCDKNTKKEKCTYSNCWIYLIKFGINWTHNVSILVKKYRPKGGHSFHYLPLQILVNRYRSTIWQLKKCSSKSSRNTEPCFSFVLGNAIMTTHRCIITNVNYLSLSTERSGGPWARTLQGLIHQWLNKYRKTELCGRSDVSTRSGL